MAFDHLRCNFLKQTTLIGYWVIGALVIGALVIGALGHSISFTLGFARRLTQTLSKGEGFSCNGTVMHSIIHGEVFLSKQH